MEWWNGLNNIVNIFFSSPRKWAIFWNIMMNRKKNAVCICSENYCTKMSIHQFIFLKCITSMFDGTALPPSPIIMIMVMAMVILNDLNSLENKVFVCVCVCFNVDKCRITNAAFIEWHSYSMDPFDFIASTSESISILIEFWIYLLNAIRYNRSIMRSWLRNSCFWFSISECKRIFVFSCSLTMRSR